MKKLFTMFGLIISISASLTLVCNAIGAGGVCGDDISWYLNDFGALNINGTGRMWDYTSESPASWDEATEYWDIKTTTINDGVTSIGAYAFYSCDKMSSISIPNTVISIREGAFYDCSLLSSVTLPNTITEIGKNAFEGCANLKRIIFNGAAMEWNLVNVETPNDILQEKVVLPDRVYISGESLLEIGATSTKQAVTYSSPTKLEYFICTVKYPSCFKLTGYTPVDFEYVSKDAEKDDGEYTTATFTCQYSGSALAPRDVTVTPFEMTFDIADDISLDTYTFTLEESTEGIDGNGNTVSFGTLEAKDVSVVPKMVENIEIVGSDTVYDKAEYTALVSPENAVNKTIEWSVSDTNIAEISQEGVLTAKKNGTVTITAKATDGSRVYAQKQVAVYAYASIDNLASDIGDWSKEFTPEDRRYTIYVDDNTETITLTPTFTGGTLLCDGVVWINGRDKTFVLDNAKTTIQLERKNVDGYEDGTYTITIIKGTDNPDEEITAIGNYYGKVSVTKTESNDKITLTITPLEDIDLAGLRMYVAEYNGGVLRGVQIGNNTTSDNSVIVTADSPISSDYKIMLWDSSYCPVIEPITNN